MNKIILQCVIVLFIGVEAFSQAKSKKYPTSKPAKKTIYNPQKLPAITAAKKPIIQPKVITSIDSNQIKKVQIANKDSLKKVQKPILGPISDGPSSYLSEKNNNENSKLSKIEKKEVNKTITKELKYKTWIKSNFEIGIKTGLSFSNINNFSKIVYSGVNIPKAKFKPGFVGGFFMNFRPNKKIQFRPEILFTQQGSQITESMNRFKYTTNNLTVPLQVKVNFGEGKLKYFVESGAYFGYALSKKSVREIGGKLIVEKIEFEKEFNFFGEKDNRIDFGPIFGAGLRYKINRAILEFDTKLQIGMAYPIVYITDRPLDLGDTGKNRVYTTSIGMIWSL